MQRKCPFPARGNAKTSSQQKTHKHRPCCCCCCCETVLHRTSTGWLRVAPGLYGSFLSPFVLLGRRQTGRLRRHCQVNSPPSDHHGATHVVNTGGKRAVCSRTKCLPGRMFIVEQQRRQNSYTRAGLLTTLRTAKS